MKTCVIGLGYVGLPTAAVLADNGHDVLGVDINKNVVDSINNGKIHIFEPDLEAMVSKAVESGSLSASMIPKESSVYLIVVPTPLKDKQPDMLYVNQVVYSISPIIKKGDLIILESTSPVGTTEIILQKIKKTRPDLFPDSIASFYLAYCPERVLPGNVIYEIINNDRVVGGISKESTEKATEFYKTFINGNIYKTNSKTAEMVKLVENSYRDLNIAFANEISMLCNEADIDVHHLISMANKHPRVNILNPGVGVGGHCIAVDPWFLIHQFPNKANIIKQSRMVNNNKTEWVVSQIIKNVDEKEIVCCMGLSYKENIDDIRESPSVKVYELLKQSIGESRVTYYDPYVNTDKYPSTDIVDCLEVASTLVFCVKHKQFTDIRIENKKILDFCGVTNDME